MGDILLVVAFDNPDEQVSDSTCIYILNYCLNTCVFDLS